MRDEPFLPTFVRELPLARAAVTYAARLREDRHHPSSEALHPLEVAALLYVAGYSEPVVTAGVLHDTIEDDQADLGALTEDPSATIYRKLGFSCAGFG